MGEGALLPVAKQEGDFRQAQLASLEAGVTGPDLEAQLRDGGGAWMARIRAICQPKPGWSDARWESEQAAYSQLCRAHHGVPDIDEEKDHAHRS